jgi:hypothetical protein
VPHALILLCILDIAGTLDEAQPDKFYGRITRCRPPGRTTALNLTVNAYPQADVFKDRLASFVEYLQD